MGRSNLSQLRDGTEGTPRKGDLRPDEDEDPTHGSVPALHRVDDGAGRIGEVGAD